MPRIAAIVQARAGSTRLPGKGLMQLQCGRTLTGFLLEGLRACRKMDILVLAVPDTLGNERFGDIAASAGAVLFRGSETDVLGRYTEAAKSVNADVVVRVCGDNPLTDPAMIDRAVEAFEGAEADYLCPAGLPLGTFGEVVSSDALFRAARECTDPAVREHVTMHIVTNTDRFRILSPNFGLDGDGLKVTVDTREDFIRVDALIERLGGCPPIGVERVIDVLRKP